ncbi:MAG: TraR/DksA family transcriptional regulator [bacterium]|jgi:RNA polymerase-binding protein DksA|nr:TraR/DksA family transcriptional regulator [bacterium]
MAQTYYTAEQLEEFRRILLEKRREALEELDYCKKELEEGLSQASGDSSTYSFHMADQGTDAQEQEKTFMFASRQGKFVQTVDAALERIEKGRYGICVKCGCLIAEQRLRIVPTAKLCVDCKTPEE